MNERQDNEPKPQYLINQTSQQQLVKTTTIQSEDGQKNQNLISEFDQPLDQYELNERAQNFVMHKQIELRNFTYNLEKQQQELTSFLSTKINLNNVQSAMPGRRLKGLQSKIKNQIQQMEGILQICKKINFIFELILGENDIQQNSKNFSQELIFNQLQRGIISSFDKKTRKLLKELLNNYFKKSKTNIEEGQMILESLKKGNELLKANSINELKESYEESQERIKILEAQVAKLEKELAYNNQLIAKKKFKHKNLKQAQEEMIKKYADANCRAETAESKLSVYETKVEGLEIKQNSNQKEIQTLTNDNIQLTKKQQKLIEENKQLRQSNKQKKPLKASKYVQCDPVANSTKSKDKQAKKQQQEGNWIEELQQFDKEFENQEREFEIGSATIKPFDSNQFIQESNKASVSLINISEQNKQKKKNNPSKFQKLNVNVQTKQVKQSEEQQIVKQQNEIVKVETKDSEVQTKDKKQKANSTQTRKIITKTEGIQTAPENSKDQAAEDKLNLKLQNFGLKGFLKLQKHLQNQDKDKIEGIVQGLIGMKESKQRLQNLKLFENLVKNQETLLLVKKFLKNPEERKNIQQRPSELKEIKESNKIMIKSPKQPKVSQEQFVRQKTEMIKHVSLAEPKYARQSHNSESMVQQNQSRQYLSQQKQQQQQVQQVQKKETQQINHYVNSQESQNQQSLTPSEWKLDSEGKQQEGTEIQIVNTSEQQLQLTQQDSKKQIINVIQDGNKVNEIPLLLNKNSDTNESVIQKQLNKVQYFRVQPQQKNISIPKKLYTTTSQTQLNQKISQIEVNRQRSIEQNQQSNSRINQKKQISQTQILEFAQQKKELPITPFQEFEKYQPEFQGKKSKKIGIREKEEPEKQQQQQSIEIEQEYYKVWQDQKQKTKGQLRPLKKPRTPLTSTQYDSSSFSLYEFLKQDKSQFKTNKYFINTSYSHQNHLIKCRYQKSRNEEDLMNTSNSNFRQIPQSQQTNFKQNSLIEQQQQQQLIHSDRENPNPEFLMIASIEKPSELFQYVYERVNELRTGDQKKYNKLKKIFQLPQLNNSVKQMTETKLQEIEEKDLTKVNIENFYEKLFQNHQKCGPNCEHLQKFNNLLKLLQEKNQGGKHLYSINTFIINSLPILQNK